MSQEQSIVENDENLTHGQRLTLIEHRLEKLSVDVEELVAAWKAASWLVNVIRVLGGVATAIAALYSLIKLKG